MTDFSNQQNQPSGKVSDTDLDALMAALSDEQPPALSLKRRADILAEMRSKRPAIGFLDEVMEGLSGLFRPRMGLAYGLLVVAGIVFGTMQQVPAKSVAPEDELLALIITTTAGTLAEENAGEDI